MSTKRALEDSNAQVSPAKRQKQQREKREEEEEKENTETKYRKGVTLDELPDDVRDNVQHNILTELHGFPRDNRIRFQEHPHRYFVDWENDGKYSVGKSMSVSRLLSSFTTSFDNSKAETKRKKMEITQQWEKKYTWLLHEYMHNQAPLFPRKMCSDLQKFLGVNIIGSGPGRKRNPTFAIPFTIDEIMTTWSNTGRIARDNGTEFHAIAESFCLRYANLAHNVQSYLHDEKCVSLVRDELVKLATFCFEKAGPKFAIPLLQYFRFFAEQGPKHDIYMLETRMFADTTTYITGSPDAVWVDLAAMEERISNNDTSELLVKVIDNKLTEKLNKPEFYGYNNMLYPFTRYRDGKLRMYFMQTGLYSYMLENFYANARWRGKVYDRIKVVDNIIIAVHPKYTNYRAYHYTKDGRGSGEFYCRNDIIKIIKIREESVKRRKNHQPDVFPFNPRGEMIPLNNDEWDMDMEDSDSDN